MTISGCVISAGWCNLNGISVQSKRYDKKEGNGGVVQFRAKLQWGWRTSPLDGHEGVSTGANLSLAHFSAIIAIQTKTNLREITLHIWVSFRFYNIYYLIVSKFSSNKYLPIFRSIIFKFGKKNNRTIFYDLELVQVFFKHKILLLFKIVNDCEIFRYVFKLTLGMEEFIDR